VLVRLRLRGRPAQVRGGNGDRDEEERDARRDKRAKRKEWQNTRIGGLVKSVNTAEAGSRIGTNDRGGEKDWNGGGRKNTLIRRYAPGSVKFDERKT